MKSIDDLKEYFKNNHFKIFDGIDVYFWVASGSVRDFFADVPPNDIDIFFSSAGEKEKAKLFLLNNGYELINEGYDIETKVAIVDGNNLKYDLVCWDGTGDPKCFATNPADCIKAFDYTVEMAALDSNLEFYHHPRFLKDVESKTLIRNRNQDLWLINNARRLNKYLKKGYNIDKENLIKYLDDQEATFEYRKQFWSKK